MAQRKAKKSASSWISRIIIVVIIALFIGYNFFLPLGPWIIYITLLLRVFGILIGLFMLLIVMFRLNIRFSSTLIPAQAEQNNAPEMQGINLQKIDNDFDNQEKKHRKNRRKKGKLREIMVTVILLLCGVVLTVFCAQDAYNVTRDIFEGPLTGLVRPTYKLRHHQRRSSYWEIEYTGSFVKENKDGTAVILDSPQSIRIKYRETFANMSVAEVSDSSTLYKITVYPRSKTLIGIEKVKTMRALSSMKMNSWSDSIRKYKEYKDRIFPLNI
ncbi:hypothetical protein [Alloscardovia omnicolens]|uniref:hypothetical protein n=1 Tax=Alloscardovia omnicolens TaxID=419015 RepID=UPI003A6206EE